MNKEKSYMITSLIQKELKHVLLSPKFTTTFAVCSLLLLLSVYIGIREYRNSVIEYDNANHLVGEELREQSQWMSLNNRTYRKPDPMQIFVAGINNDIGRWSPVNQFAPVKLRHSIYSDDTIFAIFRFIDFSFIVQIVLSLFAILFTYNAINGERESGTLALTFSNPVPKATYITAKLIGSWLGLVLPLLIPIGLAILLVSLAGIPFDGSHWLKLFQFFGVSILYVTFFIALGLLVSSVARYSPLSFLLCLIAWIMLILILPRAGVIVASQMITVPTVAEVEGKQDAYAKDRWEQQSKEMEQRLRNRQSLTANMTKEDRDKYENDHLWNWMEEEDTKRKEVQKEIDNYGITLQEDLRNRKAEQERLAFTLCRFSPASAYLLAVMDIAGTNIGLKTRYEDALQSYRTTFTTYTQKRQKESGNSGGIRISVDSQRGVSIDTPRENGTLNLTDMPRFEPPQPAGEIPILDIGILIFFTFLAFSGSVISFVRYDVRP
jgi:ABC-type transport system involved in multi-copper enzyme maturation permease subunit